jgi:hypothetical protein
MADSTPPLLVRHVEQIGALQLTLWPARGCCVRLHAAQRGACFDLFRIPTDAFIEMGRLVEI